MKLLILSFYYQPDLSAGSFRCTALVEQLMKFNDIEIDLITTLPNRYKTFSSEAKSVEKLGNVTIHRIKLPSHNSGMIDQAKAFYTYYRNAKGLINNNFYDAIYASSSRLFTAFLGARIASSKNVPLYLDVRDIFVDTIKDVLPKKIALVVKPVFSLVEKYTFGKAQRINLVSKGFEGYFRSRYNSVEYRWFTNGIDNEFIEVKPVKCKKTSLPNNIITVLYAGNIGEGQGLHKIIPNLAKTLEKHVMFKIIGDGGRKSALLNEIKHRNIINVEVCPPMSRDLLIGEYLEADVLFLHLNDYPAFKKVLPSKIFEYAAMGKPLLAGVSGYAASFLLEEVTNSAVFQPCDSEQGKIAFESLNLKDEHRTDFIQRFDRNYIMREMAKDIIDFSSGVSD